MNASPLTLDRVLPNSLDAEMAVLGCMLLSPEEAGLEVRSRLDENSFYFAAHTTLYREISALLDAGTPLDLMTLSQRLQDTNQLEAIGGPVYLADLVSRVPTTANVEHYIGIVREKHLLRQLIGAAHDVIARSFEQQDNVDDWIAEVQRQMQELTGEKDGEGFVHASAIVKIALELLERMFADKGALSGLASGYRELDRMLSGLHGGEMIVIAGRPSMGKTSLGMNIAEHVAVDQNLPVGVFSLEMSKEELIQRMIACRARVNLKKMADGFLQDKDFHALTAAAAAINKAPLYIDDTGGLTVTKMRARAKQIHKQHGIKLLVIDYIQLMRAPSRRADSSRQIEVTDISQGVKSLAKELRIPVIALCQLNRNPEGRSDGKPKVSDLRESGSIENDADVVGLLFRPEVYAEEYEKQTLQGKAVLIIAKNRNGPVGDVDLTFLKEYTRFEDQAKISDDDVPVEANS